MRQVSSRQREKWRREQWTLVPHHLPTSHPILGTASLHTLLPDHATGGERSAPSCDANVSPQNHSLLVLPLYELAHVVKFIIVRILRFFVYTRSTTLIHYDHQALGNKF